MMDKPESWEGAGAGMGWHRQGQEGVGQEGAVPSHSAWPGLLRAVVTAERGLGWTCAGALE